MPTTEEHPMPEPLLLTRSEAIAWGAVFLSLVILFGALAVAVHWGIL